MFLSVGSTLLQDWETVIPHTDFTYMGTKTKCFIKKVYLFVIIYEWYSFPETDDAITMACILNTRNIKDLL
jgi:hypothetical protein